MVWTTISPSLSERTWWPSLPSHSLSSSQFVTLPLWAPARKVLQRTTCRWALPSSTAPKVAQRTWPQKTLPLSPMIPSRWTMTDGAPTPLRSRASGLSPWKTPPVES